MDIIAELISYDLPVWVAVVVGTLLRGVELYLRNKRKK
jgi:hypothetical protein